jgi:glycerol uptake facilitator-like aquaporin
VAVVAIGACARSDALFAPGSHLPSGEWGADRVQFVTSDSVTEVAYYCVGGTFAGNIIPDATGHFVVNGSFSPYAVFAKFMPAQMSGQVSGNSLTFAVAVNDTARKEITSIGPATVKFGQHANIIVCP